MSTMRLLSRSFYARLTSFCNQREIERRGIYESLAAGTPVIFTSFVAPPLRLADWQSVAVETWSRQLLASPVINTRRLSRVLKNYESFMSGFEERREVFLWGTRPFQERLAAVVADVFVL